ncbi:MAG: alkaline phosphatase D family protein [Candidatus Aminicenantes bacterium]|nr:MAG: alkaline phosphatase D family protein [Candidatus Aminicenantes bacterium]
MSVSIKISIFCLVLFFSFCSVSQGPGYSSQWGFSPDGPWTGPELWANRLQDWQVANGKLECLSSLPMRTVHLTTMRLNESEGDLESSVLLQKISGGNDSDAAAGYLLGAGGDMDYRSASLIHHSYGKQAGLFVGCDGQGQLFVRDHEQKDEYLIYQEKNAVNWDKIRLDLKLKSGKRGYRLTLEAMDLAKNDVLSRLVIQDLPADRFVGNVALVSHGGYASETDNRFAFEDWDISGSKLECFPDRNLGPMVTALYTLSRGTLKLTVQFMPLAKSENQTVDLYLLISDNWEHAATSAILRPSYTVPFRIENWNHQKDVPFRVEYALNREQENKYILEGIVKKDPTDKDKLVMISMSCVKQVVKPGRGFWSGIDGEWYPWDWGILYPHADLEECLKKHEPDVLFFAGDQIYEGSSPTRADREHAFLDYLYKWYLWCISNKELTNRVPTIAIPDDHDVYHGNVWGAGGKATDPGLTGAEAQDSGGYRMSPEFVNMVQTTQTSHLPDPVDPQPVEQGIGVYFTECNIGGLSIAVLEDRKFKSAPRKMFPEADIINGWVQNPQWSVKQKSRIADAVLLGERQLKFLEKWAGDWSQQTWMKVAVSQTLFSNVATLPESATSDGVVPGLEIPDAGAYVKGDKQVADFDSNGWPQVGRDKAIRLFRKAFATHIVGDQHLANTSQYGVEEWRDSGYVIVSPATGNLFPRRWWPPVPGKNRLPDSPKYTGDFEDGFGNKVTVYAIANPQKTTIQPERHHELATGYSVITFSKYSRDIELTNWPYWADPAEDKPFPGWPILINQLDNYGTKARAWLPEVRVTGLIDPVIQIYRQQTEEMVYALRINGQFFQPKVFESGIYTIKIGEPDKNMWQEFRDIQTKLSKDISPLEVIFP